MKTQLLKGYFNLFLVALIACLPLLQVTGQAGEILQGGSMEEADADSWTVDIIGRMETDPVGDQIPEYEFGYAESCTNCDGNVLRVWAAGTGYVNIIFSQEVTLKANTVYKASAAFKDLSGGILTNFWAQLKLNIDTDPEPPEHENDGEKLMGFNYWLGCGPNVDGTFQDDACDANEDLFLYNESEELIGFAGYTTPDSLGAEFTAYFAIVVGMWTNAETGAFPYDVAIDEVSLIDSAAAATSIKQNVLNNNIYLVNYPNPFNEQTTVAYYLPERSYVKIRIYNLLGEEIINHIEGMKDAGSYETLIDLSNARSNILICKLEFNDKVIIRRMTLIK